MQFLKDQILNTAALFEDLGTQFVTPPQVLANKLKNVSAFIFDWDGVFNDGFKGIQSHSNFAEPDAMALHTLRYAYWRLHGKLPIIAIITGQHNESAFQLAEREHLPLVLAGFRNKFEALDRMKIEFGLNQVEMAAVFDDIIDYPLASSTSVRFLVNRKASPLFKKFFVENQLCDVVTASESGNYAVREISEIVIGLWGNYNDMLISRFKEPEQYETFWNLRQSVKTQIIKN
jgi:3-deoxy-D-manno-octulosonate 8-phosphate phosphatase (KDO 8-P phosphatase)